MLCNTAGYHPEPIMPSAADEAILQWCKMESCLWCMPQMRVMCWLCSQDHLDRLAKTFQSLCHQQLKLWFVLFAHFVCLRYRKSSSSNFFSVAPHFGNFWSWHSGQKSNFNFHFGGLVFVSDNKRPENGKVFFCACECMRGCAGVVSVGVCVMNEIVWWVCMCVWYMHACLCGCAVKIKMVR